MALCKKSVSVLKLVGMGGLGTRECMCLLACKEVKHFNLTLLSWLTVVTGILTFFVLVLKIL